MKKALISIFLADLAFLAFLMLSGFFGGVLFYVAYSLAFVLPFLTAMYFNKSDLSQSRYLSIDKYRAGIALPLVPITVLAVIVLSVFTSIILGLLGLTDDVTIGGTLPSALVVYALLPAVFEELLFRYLPLRLMSHKSAKTTVLLSALLFSAVHLDPFQLVYAFAAGAIFMTVDIMTDSVIPSIVIHFINNALSVLTFFLQDYPIFIRAYLPTLLVLSVLAVINIASRRAEYSYIFRKKLLYAN